MKKNNLLSIIISALFLTLLFFTASVAFADVKNVNWTEAAQKIGCDSEQACRVKYDSLNPDTLEGARELQGMWSFFNTQKGVYTQAEQKTLSDTQRIIVAQLTSAQTDDEFNQAVLNAARAVVQKNPELAKKYGISNQEVRRVEQEQKASDALEQAMRKFNCGGGDADECGRGFEGAIADGKDTGLYEQIAREADKNAGNKSDSANSYYTQYKQMINRFNRYVQLPPSPSDINYRPGNAQKMSKEAMLAFCDNAPNPEECKKGIEKSFGVVSPNQPYVMVGDMMLTEDDFKPRKSLNDPRCPSVAQAPPPFGCYYSHNEETSYSFNGIQCPAPKLVCSEKFPKLPTTIYPVYPTTPSQPPYDVLGKKFDTIDGALSFCKSIATAVPVPICMELAARNNNPPPPPYPSYPLPSSGNMVKVEWGSGGSSMAPQSVASDSVRIANIKAELARNCPTTTFYQYLSADWGVASCPPAGVTPNSTTGTGSPAYSTGYQPPMPGMPPSTNNWVNHTWNLRDGSTQFSSILNRTDKEYIDFIASKDAEARTGYFNGWELGGGSQSIWREFGIPKISTTSVTPIINPGGGSYLETYRGGLYKLGSVWEACMNRLGDAADRSLIQNDLRENREPSWSKLSLKGQTDTASCERETGYGGIYPPSYSTGGSEYCSTGPTGPATEVQKCQTNCYNTSNLAAYNSGSCMGFRGAQSSGNTSGYTSNFCGMGKYSEYTIPMPGVGFNAAGVGQGTCFKPGMTQYIDVSGNNKLCSEASILGCSGNSSAYGMISSSDTCSKYLSILPGAHMHGGGACVGSDEQSWVYNTDPIVSSSVKNACTTAVPSGVAVSCSSSSTTRTYSTMPAGGCPSSQYWNGYSCITFTPLPTSCPSGQYSCNNVCIPSASSCISTGSTYIPPSTGTYMPTGGCPSGQYWNGYSCITSTPPSTNTYQAPGVACATAGGTWNTSSNYCQMPGMPSGTYSTMPAGGCPSSQYWNGSVCMPSPSMGTYSTDPGIGCTQYGGTWDSSKTPPCQMPGMPSGTYSTMPAGGCPSSQYWNGSVCMPSPSMGTYTTDPATACAQGNGIWNASTNNCQMPAITTPLPTGSGYIPPMTPDQGCKQTYGSAASWNGSKCIGGTSPTASIIDIFRYWFSR